MREARADQIRSDLMERERNGGSTRNQRGRRAGEQALISVFERRGGCSTGRFLQLVGLRRRFAEALLALLAVAGGRLVPVFFSYICSRKSAYKLLFIRCVPGEMRRDFKGNAHRWGYAIEKLTIEDCVCLHMSAYAPIW